MRYIPGIYGLNAIVDHVVKSSLSASKKIPSSQPTQLLTKHLDGCPHAIGIWEQTAHQLKVSHCKMTQSPFIPTNPFYFDLPHKFYTLTYAHLW